MIPLFFSRSSNNARGIEAEVLIYATQSEKGFYFSKNKKPKETWVLISLDNK